MNDTLDPLALVLLWSIVGGILLVLSAAWRRFGSRALPFVLLLGANLTLAIIALSGGGSQRAFYLLCLMMFCLLVVVPAGLGYLARIALRRDRFGMAALLLGIRGLLQPGLGMAAEVRAVRSMHLARQGRLEEALAQAEIDFADAASDEVLRAEALRRAMTLCLFGQRPHEALALWQRHGNAEWPERSVQLCAALVRTYCETGLFEDAAACQATLERLFGSDPVYAGVVNAARIVFLAHHGRVGDVEHLLSHKSLFPEMRRTRRDYWHAVALAYAGQHDEARRMWKVIAEEADPALAAAAQRRLEETAKPAEAREETADLMLIETVASRASRYGDIPRNRGRYWQDAPLSTGLLVAIGLTFVASVLVGRHFGEVGEGWALVRLGANFVPLTLWHEPWRLLTSLFLHGGGYHLAFNAYALFLLGRLTEQMFGSARMLIIYGVAGIAGSIASCVYAAGILSVGASGAIFGLLGAFLVGLHQLKGRVPEGWRRRLSINLIVVIGFQLAIGLMVPVIDNAAHVGGLFGGGIAGWFARPLASHNGRWRRRLAAGLAVAMAVACLGSLIAMGLNGTIDTLRRAPRHDVTKAGTTVSSPAFWTERDGKSLSLRDPLLPTGPTLAQSMIAPFPRDASLDDVVAVYQAQILNQLRRLGGVDRAKPASQRTISRNVAGTETVLYVGEHVIRQLNYFVRVDDALVVLFGRVPDESADIYRPILDGISGSVRLANAK